MVDNVEIFLILFYHNSFLTNKKRKRLMEQSNPMNEKPLMLTVIGLIRWSDYQIIMYCCCELVIMWNRSRHQNLRRWWRAQLRKWWYSISHTGSSHYTWWSQGPVITCTNFGATIRSKTMSIKIFISYK